MPRGLQLARRARLVVSALAMFAVLTPSVPAEAQDGPRVVINELFYHPPCQANYTPCPDAPAEFVEIHNPGNTSVDVGGWSLADGVEFFFAPGTSVPAGGYLVVADDSSGFTEFFGQAALGPWSGGLSNSGERVALVDDLGAVIDSVTYSDGADTPGAWSVDADGNGDSLSLLSAENADGSSFWWSGAVPTPGAQNANAGQAPSSVVENFAWTVLPTENQPIDVSADVYSGASVTLEYRIGFPGDTQTLPMTPGAGNTWTAQIPASAYSAGDLVRFRIVNSGTQVAPKPDDSIGWVGTTVADPSIDSPVPVIEWFTSDSDYRRAQNYTFYEHLEAEPSSRVYGGVLAYNGQIWDNITYRTRGQIARGPEWDKRNWKFKIPDGHKFFIDGIDYGIDSLDLQGGFADEARIREVVGHLVADEVGLVASQVQHVQLRLNGEFFGLHTLQEHPEGGFLKDNGIPNATLYKGVDLSDRQAGPNVSPAQEVGWETWDIPEFINLMAAATLVQHNDYAHGNVYSWYDADEHQRIEAMIWDLDLSQGIRYAPTEGLTTVLAFDNFRPYAYQWGRWEEAELNYIGTVFVSQALKNPYRELYLRRVRTLADEWFGTGRFEQLSRDTFATITGANGGDNLWAMDTQKWGFWEGDEQPNNAFNGSQQQAIDRHSNDWIDGFYDHLIGRGGPDRDIPGPQPANPSLDLIVDAAPADQRAERIEIRNLEETAIDISGWQISGSTTATLAPGAVLPSNGSAYLVFDDTAGGYRTVTRNHYVLGEYAGALPDINGALALTDPNGTEQAATQWGAGATPAALILNEWNAVSSSNLLLNGDTRLGTIAGNGGDWFELVVVEDNLDVRGWSLTLTDDGEENQTLTFTNDDLWSDLRAGTIITVAERPITSDDGTVYDEDVSYRPESGDWWIHVVAGASGSGTYVTNTNYRVSNDEWQLAVYDTAGTRRFGPAGEGIGTLAAGGVSNAQIGELEQDPGPDTDASSAYGDGDGSSFGEANEFDERRQDFSALRPDIETPGDVDCSARTDIVDALVIAQFSVGNRTDHGSCPLVDPATQINAAAGDINRDGTTTIVDALLVSQCTVGIVNDYCGP